MKTEEKKTMQQKKVNLKKFLNSFFVLLLDGAKQIKIKVNPIFTFYTFSLLT